MSRMDWVRMERDEMDEEHWEIVEMGWMVDVERVCG